MKIVKKTELNPGKAALYRILAVLAALLCAALIMLCMGFNPLTIFGKLIEGSVMSPYRFRETINKAIPLVVLSLGICIAFRMKFWNIGAEGQLYMGALGASYVALFGPEMPMWLTLCCMMAASLVMGALWSLIPAALKHFTGASESLVTLMMNYIAIKWVSYLQYGPWRDPKASGMPKIAIFSDRAILPKVMGVHIGWIIALVLVALTYVMLRYTKLGYEISVLGESVQTARYAGMNTAKVLLIAVGLSGALCGLAGMIQASAVETSLSDQLSGGLGYTAIITTWLSQLSAPVIVGVSFLFAMLLQGGAYLQSAMQIPAAVADILQGVILFFVLGCEFFLQYKLVRDKK